MAASFGRAGLCLAANSAFSTVPRCKLVPKSHCWYRWLSATASGAGDTAAKPKSESTLPQTEAPPPKTEASSSVVKADVVQRDKIAAIKEKPALDLPSEEESFVERFIPISRKSLVRELMEDDFLLESEKKQFEKFATALDAAIINQYHGNLAELKLLFDAINPDKDTVSTRQVLPRERKDNEFWLLQKLAVLMERANFYELPESVVDAALEEHEAGEGVLVSVNKKNYDVLRFWALGREVPEQRLPWYQSIPKAVFYRATKRSAPPPPKYFKRVVVAVRPKGQDKLSLKMFKEVPAGALEHLLPDGKIRMTKFDQGLIATSVSIGALTLLVKAVSLLADVQLKWTLIIASVTGLAGLRFWNSYKNRRVKYLMQLSRTLFYKNVANNRGLLVLLVDRAQDESFKEALIMYTFLLSHRKPASAPLDQKALNEPETLGGIRTSILERNIERWVKTKTGAQIEFDSSAASELLKTFSVLQVDDEDNNSVVPLASAILSLPHRTPSIISRTDDIELEEGYDKVYFEQEDMYDKDEKKQRAHGWS